MRDDGMRGRHGRVSASGPRAREHPRGMWRVSEVGGTEKRGWADAEEGDKTSLVTARDLVLDLSHREPPGEWKGEFAALISI